MSQALLFTVQRDGDYSSLNIEDCSSSSIQNWYNDALKPYLKITIYYFSC